MSGLDVAFSPAPFPMAVSSLHIVMLHSTRKNVSFEEIESKNRRTLRVGKDP